MYSVLWGLLLPQRNQFMENRMYDKTCSQVMKSILQAENRYYRYNTIRYMYFRVCVYANEMITLLFVEDKRQLHKLVV